jgi:outer membrane protein assembly factor BamD
MNYSLLNRFTIAILILFMSGCAYNLILLSPQDHYALGDYYLQQGKYSKASQQFEKIKNDYPTSEYATMSQYKLAETNFLRKRYQDAALDFEIFLEFHPAHKLAPKGYYYLAISKYNLIRSPEREIINVKEAQDTINTFLMLYPEHPDAPEIKRYKTKVENHLLTHEFEVGMVYFRRKVYRSALNRFLPILEKTPESGLLAKTRYHIARCYEKTKQQDEARVAYKVLIDSKSDPKWVNKAQKRLSHLN